MENEYYEDRKYEIINKIDNLKEDNEELNKLIDNKIYFNINEKKVQNCINGNNEIINILKNELKEIETEIHNVSLMSNEDIDNEIKELLKGIDLYKKVEK